MSIGDPRRCGTCGQYHGPFCMQATTEHMSACARLDEALAEIAAYQGKPEGALPGWEPIGSALNGYRLLGRGWFVFVQLIGAGPRWQACFSGDALASFTLEADSPRQCMRDADARVLSLGLTRAVPPPAEASKGCNRHKDCAQANVEYRAKHGVDMPFNQCCHDEDCEDCFGC